MMKRLAICLALTAAAGVDARADLFEYIRIGDIDGFGYNNAPGFRKASGGPANIGGPGVLTNGDFLPDINRDGAVATGRGDEFDFRTAGELANTSTSGVGVASSAGTVGSKFTDISLARTYDDRSAANRILVGGNPNDGLVFGPGGAFPMPPSDTLPNQPGFVFNFTVNKADYVDTAAPIFFNLIFGDYDVTPASLRITRANNSTQTINLLTQGNNQDGLIQAATAFLTFADVFSDGGSTWNGYLKIDFLAPNEPYTAFDYVELSTRQLVVPEPSSVILTAVGAVGLVGYARRRRRSA